MEIKITGKISDPVYNSDDQSEVVIGLVGAVGTDMEQIRKCITERLAAFKYSTTEIHISTDIISQLRSLPQVDDNFDRINSLMTEGNHLRRISKDNAILARVAAAKINNKRAILETNGLNTAQPTPKKAYIINSLKHPDEVKMLRDIYTNGFYLIGVHASENRRKKYLHDNKNVSLENAQILIDRDSEEKDGWGQHTRDTFELSDFFISYNGQIDQVNHDLSRVFDLLFGSPYITPTFDEYAMFMAFSAALRSADLSRQVGAVLTQNKNIVSTGANDVPASGGGLYWPEHTNEGIKDHDLGRDYKRGYDSNVKERQSIIDDILEGLPHEHHQTVSEALKISKLKYITEYGRVVHAEMDAILSCARSNISTQGGVLYCTTFPCHNCAKHIIASGIKKVFYIEPYPKSKAFEFHPDSITTADSDEQEGKVIFAPFTGVGPRCFFNLFSISLGAGYKVKRKDKDGDIIKWERTDGKLRVQMLPSSYIERESVSADIVARQIERLQHD